MTDHPERPDGGAADPGGSARNDDPRPEAVGAEEESAEPIEEGVSSEAPTPVTPRLTRRATIAGLGVLGLYGAGHGLSTQTDLVDGYVATAIAQSDPDDNGYEIGNGATSVHDGAVVIADASPSQFTSEGPNEVRSQIPMYAPSFNTTSARTAKTDVEPVDPGTILEGVESLDVCTWSFADDRADDGRHVGPMAADFQAAFDLDGPDGSIATVDADGVALAAIQGLLERLEADNETLREEIRDRREAIEDLESRLADLEREVSAE